MRDLSRANGRFLATVVRCLCDAGIRQFLDIGTGLPAPDNTHEVAQRAARDAARIVYADYDPIVLAHARALLTSGEAGATEYIDSDLRDTQTILGATAKLLDFTKPMAVTLISILHAIPDGDDPHAIVVRLLGAVPSGSYLAISHMGPSCGARSAANPNVTGHPAPEHRRPARRGAGTGVVPRRTR